MIYNHDGPPQVDDGPPQVEKPVDIQFTKKWVVETFGKSVSDKLHLLPKPPCSFVVKEKYLMQFPAIEQAEEIIRASLGFAMMTANHYGGTVETIMADGQIIQKVTP
jgi:hypothetical protein